MGKICNVQLKYRFGSLTSYEPAVSRGPKVIVLSTTGMNLHASRQLTEFRSVPRVRSQPNFHPLGKSGRINPGPLVETLSAETYVSFHTFARSFDDGERNRTLLSLSGNAIMPFHCWGRVLDRLDRVDALTAPWRLFDRSMSAFQSDSASEFG